MGFDFQEEDFRSISKRIALKIREFNLREGMTPEDDWLPERFFTEPIGEDGRVLDREEFRELVDEYYRLRGYAPR
jgi:aldehyde:ferredoxin oxidoreductase